MLHHASASTSHIGPIGPSDPGVVDEQVDRSELAPQLGASAATEGALVGDVGGRGGRDAAGALR